MGNVRFMVLASVFCALVATAAGAYRHTPSAPLETGAEGRSEQDVSYLDRRINTLEQRLYTIESRIGGLEQQAIQSRRSSPSQPARDPVVDQLHAEINTLQGRVRELECAVVRLDERTLPEAAKTARGRAAVEAKDPCRQNAQGAVRLSSRP